MIVNTQELPPDLYQDYKVRLLTTHTFRYNENGILTPTNNFLRSVNSFVEKGLDKAIISKAPDISKSLIISACLLVFHPKIQKNDFLHILNISLESMGEFQIENTQYDKFLGWMEYFFQPILPFR